MPGFSNNALNIAFENGFINRIISHLIKCCSDMKNDCMVTGKMLYNHEDKITNRLVEMYLNKGSNIVRYETQAPENFDPVEDRYLGRVDIRVRTLNRFFRSSDDYYIIECKRIDGSKELNKDYITCGVERFVSNPPKYRSFHKRNMMLGYVVKSLDIAENAKEIELLQRNTLDGITPDSFAIICSKEDEHYIYSCHYISRVDSIQLYHIFFNFADVVSA